MLSQGAGAGAGAGRVVAVAGRVERNKWRKKSHVSGEDVVTCSDGPAARKKGTLEGGR